MGKFNPPVVKKDIERCHRFGRVGSQHNQPGTSIVHFASGRIRDSVYRSRGKNITSGATSEPKYSSPKTKQNHDQIWRTKREDTKAEKDQRLLDSERTNTNKIQKRQDCADM